jgi:precorrin-3B C17-methyltransferase
MKIYAVGLGPGAVDLLSPRAAVILENCDVIAGYNGYIEQFAGLLENKEIIGNGMRGEIKRCREALDAVLAGKNVAMICSGDAGIYAMAGLLAELIEEEKYSGIELVTVPGITAAGAAAAVLGAPLMNDFCVLSLSDLLTPSSVIRKRVKAVAAADLVTVLYNPASKKRRELLAEAIKIFLDFMPSETPVGIVHNATKQDEKSSIVTLGDFPFEEIDMNTLVIIGNSNTVKNNGIMYTQRGYIEKYGR